MDREPSEASSETTLIRVAEDGSYESLCSPRSLVELRLEGWEYLDYPSAKSLVLELSRTLHEESKIMFETVNFLILIQRYWLNRIIDKELMNMIYRPNVRCMWDEMSIAEMFLTCGFRKVWTGPHEGLPPSMFQVIAIK